MGKAIVLALLSLLLVGCAHTRYVTETHYRDSIRTVLSVDTLLLRDSVYVRERTSGDTVYVDKEMTRYVYRYVGRTDTAYVHTSDSVPYPVVRKVTEYKYQTRWYDKACLILTALTASIFVGWYVVRRLRKTL